MLPTRRLAADAPRAERALDRERPGLWNSEVSRELLPARGAIVREAEVLSRRGKRPCSSPRWEEIALEMPVELE